MIKLDRELKELIELGISEREAKLYLTMLEYGEVTANDLHRLTGIQRSRVYSILSRMVVHGLCNERQEGRNRFFTALNPKRVKEAMVRQWEAERSEKEETAERIFDKLEDTFNQGEQETPLHRVELIRNANNIHNKYMELVEETQQEILAYVKPPIAATTRKTRELQFNAQERALKRGVLSRTIFSLKDLAEIDIEWTQLDELDQMRVVERLPVKMFIFDGLKALFGIPSTADRNTKNFFILFVDDPGFCEVLVESFEKVWERALPVEVLKGNSISWSKEQEHVAMESMLQEKGLSR